MATATAGVGPAVVDLDTSTGDLAFSPYGDMGLVAGQAWAQARLYRRLVTVPGSLLLHPEYGGGLGDVVGKPLLPQDVPALQARISTQVALESWVQSVDSVAVDLAADQGTLTVTVAVTAATGGSTWYTLLFGQQTTVETGGAH